MVLKELNKKGFFIWIVRVAIFLGIILFIWYLVKSADWNCLRECGKCLK